MKHYNEANVLKALTKKGIKVDEFKNTLMIPVDKDGVFLNNIGIRTLCKIDYLVNYKGYSAVKVRLTK